MGGGGKRRRGNDDDDDDDEEFSPAGFLTRSTGKRTRTLLVLLNFNIFFVYTRKFRERND